MTFERRGTGRFAVEGVGAVGGNALRQLLASPSVAQVIVRDPRSRSLDDVAATAPGSIVIDPGRPGEQLEADVVVLAGPVGTHLEAARLHVDAGRSVVSVSDAPDEVAGLLDLDGHARRHGCVVAVGAAFAPGLSDLLAGHGATWFSSVSEVHVARVGTGGPACARAHHRALRGEARDWRDGAWVERRGGAGRELVWFPDPLGARDCYSAALADPLLLVDAIAGVTRVTSRQAATRRDRLTARLPMLRRPHADGGPGAVRVELRGLREGMHDVVVLGAMDRPAVASGAVAAEAALAIAAGASVRHGAGGLAALFTPLTMLQALAARGVRCAVFDPAHVPPAGD